MSKTLPFYLLLTAGMMSMTSHSSFSVAQNAPYRTPGPGLRGKDYQGKCPSPDDLRSGLADWDVLADDFDDIQSVRIVGFAQLSPTGRIDISRNDSDVLSTLRHVLSAGIHMRRAALSDLSSDRGAIGGGAHRGVISIGRKNHEPLIIGVSALDYYLGVYHGTVHQSFTSWLLTKQLDDIIYSETGKHLPGKMFRRLSGEQQIIDAKKLYQRLRKKAAKPQD